MFQRNSYVQSEDPEGLEAELGLSPKRRVSSRPGSRRANREASLPKAALVAAAAEAEEKKAAEAEEKKAAAVEAENKNAEVANAPAERTSPVDEPATKECPPSEKPHRSHRALMIVDRHVDPKMVIGQAALSDVKVLYYDSATDRAAYMVEMIQRAHLENRIPFKCVAFANHGSPSWKLAADCVVHLCPDDIERTFHSVTGLQTIMSSLVASIKKSGRVDLMACNLMRLDNNLLHALEELYGVDFTASDDETGNVSAGGNWVMESDDINIVGDYFDLELIKKFDGLMAGFWDGVGFFTDWIPGVGTAVRATQAVSYHIGGYHEDAKGAWAEAGQNLAGDVAGLVTGGVGKVAASGAKAGYKGAKAIRNGVKAYERVNKGRQMARLVN